MPIPTAPSRIRQRGYDQALLLAKELGRLRRLSVVQCLEREHDLRQVGVGRTERKRQAATAFRLKKRLSRQLEDKQILLVDDVVTTGATLSAAANVLSGMGISSLDAGVVAWQLPRDKR